MKKSEPSKKLRRYIFVVILIVFAGISVISWLNEEKELTNSTEEELTNRTEVKKTQTLRDTLNYFLSQRGLNICTVIDDYLNMDDEVVKIMDKKYPNIPPKGYYTNKLNQAVTKYRKKHEIDEITFNNIKKFLDECLHKEAERERKNTLALKAARENFRNTCLSGWDGRHRALANWVKDRLNNPSSFDHVETRFGFKYDYVNLEMKYRAENGFGATITTYILAKVSLTNCDKILEIQGQ